MVLAADSRGTFGDPRGVTAQNDTMRKVVKLNENCGLLLSGAGELGDNIVTEIEKVINSEKIKSVTEVLNKARQILKAKYDEWFDKFPPMPSPQNPNFLRPVLGIIIGGYEKRLKNSLEDPKIYSMVSLLDFPPSLHRYGFALQGVPQYALYLLNRMYSPELKVEGLKHLLAYVINETATQDGKVGGPIQMIIIDKRGCREVSQKEIKRIIKTNYSISDALKDLWRRQL